MSDSTRKTIVLVHASLLFALVAGAHVQAGEEPYAKILGKATAKGMALMEIHYPTGGSLKWVTLYMHLDDGETVQVGAGLPRPSKLFTSVSERGSENVVLIPVVARFGAKTLVFPERGQYRFRWDLHFSSRSDDVLRVDQEIEVLAPTSADLGFLSGLSDAGLCRAMFKADACDQLTETLANHYAVAEVLEVEVVGCLLYATRDHWIGNIMSAAGPRGDVRKAAEMLLALAKDIPDSSYAPYAAYYAGCCYWATCLKEADEASRAQKKKRGSEDEFADGKYRAQLLKKNPDLAKAHEAFTLAAQQADDYLKPRVLFQHGTMRVFCLDLDEAERLLVKATQVAPGDRTIKKWFDKMLGEMNELREEIEKAKTRLRGVEDSASDTPK